MLIKSRFRWCKETGRQIAVNSKIESFSVALLDDAEYAVFDVPASHALLGYEVIQRAEKLELSVSTARFTSLLGFGKVAEICELALTNKYIRAAESMMTARTYEGVTLDSNSMSLYYNLLKSVAVLDDAEIERIKSNKTEAELEAEQ